MQYRVCHRCRHSGDRASTICWPLARSRGRFPGCFCFTRAVATAGLCWLPRHTHSLDGADREQLSYPHSEEDVSEGRLGGKVQEEILVPVLRINRPTSLSCCQTRLFSNSSMKMWEVRRKCL